MPIIRKIVALPVARDLWKKTISPTANSEIQCPACRRKMSNVALEIGDTSTYLDVCRRCHFIWLDPQEFEILQKKQRTTPVRTELPPQGQRALAHAMSECLDREWESKEVSADRPEHWWQEVLVALRIPVEYNDDYTMRTPFATYAIAAVLVLVMAMSSDGPGSILPCDRLDSTITNWGLVPSQFMRHSGLTFISSFLLHGGFIHLLYNLYFLLVFGDNVEDSLGTRRYLYLIGLSGLVGNLAYILADPRASTPLVGASGGVSGLLTYYCLRFPSAKVYVLGLCQWSRIPVGVWLGTWFFGLISGAYGQIPGFGKASLLAHLGGALAAVLFWYKLDCLPNLEGSKLCLDIDQ